MTVHENDAKAAAALWPKVQTLCKKETGRDTDSKRETEREREGAGSLWAVNKSLGKCMQKIWHFAQQNFT